MKFNIIKTRNGKLRNKLSNNFLNNKLTEEDIDLLMSIIDDYEKANLLVIEKLRKEKKIEAKRISGALKQTIHAHGAITKVFIGSATKRIMGALLTNEKKESFINKLKKFFIKWIS